MPFFGPNPTRFLQRIPEAAAVLLALLVAATLYIANRYDDELDLLRHSVEVQAALGRAESRIQAAESGQRGFLLSNNDVLLSNLPSCCCRRASGD